MITGLLSLWGTGFSHVDVVGGGGETCVPCRRRARLIGEGEGSGEGGVGAGVGGLASPGRELGSRSGECWGPS